MERLRTDPGKHKKMQRTKKTAGTGQAASLAASSDFSRIPYVVFHDPALYESEQARIFQGPVWCYLGLEAEIPEPGDFRTTFVGDMPVVFNRAEDSVLHAFENRCAHRGSIVQRAPYGRTETHTCIYHQWCYDNKGDLVGVPFRKGIKGKGGHPADFELARHGLRKFRVASYKGVIFGTLSSDTGPLTDYLDAPVRQQFDRIFSDRLSLLGYARQVVNANWKLYNENVRDPYHASLLHLFHQKFGTYRSTQQGATLVANEGRHCIILARTKTDNAEETALAYTDTKVAHSNFRLRDMSMFTAPPDFEDGITTAIISVFPNLVVQQIANTLATRQIRPRGPDQFELFWTYFGFAKDSPATQAQRLKAANLIGPGGYISMEDGEATTLCQRGTLRAQDAVSFIEMGGRGPVVSCDHLVTEVPIRGFWQSYSRLMGDAVTG